MKWVKPQSLYLQLLLFLGLPLILLWGLSAFNSYVNALQAATQAYDRTLLSSARTVSERLVVRNNHLEVNVPWVVLDSFELNMNDRLYYKVVDPSGKVISGYDDLPVMPPATPRTRLYPALAWFYHTEYRGEAIRVARLLQPFHRLDNVGNVAGAGIGLALVNDIARLHRTHPHFSRSEALGGLYVRIRFLSLVPQ
ncbi:hypothetical protein E1371_20310 [Salmonella enterica subsp. enterica serovar Senftenberg]|nr:hypothetical protein [Salmonella enterica subsp. enterica serovar Senftenberg]HAB3735170.1 hypothetical protein [Salmonella enterica subsp. enterica serovar Senftenberg]